TMRTDGTTNASRPTIEEAIEATKRARVAVYTVVLLSQSGGEKAEDSLIHIAEASGGRAYFPQNVDDARTAMERVARDLREQYTLGYFPAKSDLDGSWRSVRGAIIRLPGASAKRALPQLPATSTTTCDGP